MTKIVSIDNRYTWKITRVEDPILGTYYHGTCGRLNLKEDGMTIDEVIDLAQLTMYDLFRTQYEKGNLNDFAFKHSATYRIKELEGFVDLSVPTIIIEDE